MPVEQIIDFGRVLQMHGIAVGLMAGIIIGVVLGMWLESYKHVE